MVPIVTPALYRSNAALNELFTAVECHIPLFPLLFEGPIPDKKDMWPLEDRGKNVSETEHVHMVAIVQRYFCRKNVFPEPGPHSGIVNCPHLLSEAVRRIAGVLKQLLGGAGEHEVALSPAVYSCT